MLLTTPYFRAFSITVTQSNLEDGNYFLVCVYCTCPVARLSEQQGKSLSA